ncbi:hypothetical protein GPECTOR_5g331 [Gonium pectorale]|uniref:Uncharacterized protein n=1 Tax=Gonium pectorale TaxID=33097 RepID=A0A150GWK8_GONPE|nr:hypothetical protein GPECTOR_5g331 [Gonium pectorale]|eukprot:KXZ54241.1 hypothetical protein GPECTOR_5g331 [Gonium pectorale]
MYASDCEHIDLTRAIKRCRSWQQLRRLYWANRTRHGPVNVVTYWTQLAVLLPDLPELLATETEGEGGDEDEDEDAGDGGDDAGSAHAGSYCREHVAAGRLEAAMEEVQPWRTDAFSGYLADRYGVDLQRTRGSAATPGSSGGARGGGGGRRGPDHGRAPDDGSLAAAVAALRNRERQGPVTFLDWVGTQPERWCDPVAVAALNGLEHWDQPPPPPPLPGGRQPLATAATTLGALAVAAGRRRRLPQCFGPLELSTLAWAAGRLRLAAAVPEHAPWLLHDLLYGSYLQMRAFDGRQLAQLSYSLATLGPCVPPARWRQRFLEEAGPRLGAMDGQSLANLAHSLEPLRLEPGPAWLRSLMAASGALLAEHSMSGAELTQLAWAVLSARRRLYQPRRWATEVLAVSRAALQWGAARSRGDTAAATSALALAAPAAPVEHPLLTALPRLLSLAGEPPLSGRQAVELRELLMDPGRHSAPQQQSDGYASGSPASAAGPLVTGTVGQSVGNAGGSSFEAVMVGAVSCGSLADAPSSAQAGDSDLADPWVSDLPSLAVLSRVAKAGGLHGGLGIWLLRQPPAILLAVRALAHDGSALCGDWGTAEAGDKQSGRPGALGACWPSAAWLAALAAAATAQLRSPSFRAQSLGIMLWSLAGLGYVPPPGWLTPWLHRAVELQADFRPPNLVSVLCALSAWGQLPAGRPGAALRSVAVRLLPDMGPRELQLAASALAQLCSLPEGAPEGLRELGAAALDAAKAVAGADSGSVLGDREAAALLPERWWRAYVAALAALRDAGG